MSVHFFVSLTILLTPSFTRTDPLCPYTTHVRSRCYVYRQVSRKIRAIFETHTPLVEPLSLDEAYLDVTENLKGYSSATELAEDIRAEIFAQTGLTASAGISYNKFLAKLGSGDRKSVV